MSELQEAKFHFIGVGGIGMSGLAKLMLRDGCAVTGSDQEDSSAVEEIRRLGADIKIGHSRENIVMPVNAVVISAAIKEGNPEYDFACEQGCRIYKYAEMLGAIMDQYDGVAVCGTHGKSTTSAWLSFVMREAGLDPNFIVGADIPQLSSNSGAGGGRFFIAEACEYDRSFLNLHPKVAVLLNIEQDHLDYYADEAEIVEAFREFVKGVRDDGVIIANGADANVMSVVDKLKFSQKLLTFGIGAGFGISAQKLRLVGGFYEFDVFHGESHLGRVRIGLAGEHNVLNALAVIGSAIAAGVGTPIVLEHLGRFTGIDRRLMFKGKVNGVTVLDDYAHHPTEIRASLQAIRQCYCPERIWCVFQPHQYSRTRFLLDDFAESFKLADVTIVPEIYFVRDTAEAKSQVNSEVLVDRICSEGSEAVFIDDFAGICEYLERNVQGGDVVVTMGAGDIWKVADEYIQWFRRDS
jgi:UDP-N-acetylmuramate--alanine ligase